MIKKKIAVCILILFGSQYSHGQFDRAFNGFIEMDKLEKDKKHLLDSLKKDFKSKLNQMKRTYEIEYANSLNELLDELNDVFKSEKKILQKGLKANRKALKKSAFDRRREIQKTQREEVIPVKLDEYIPTKIEKPNSLINDAEEYLGTPYKYGGTSRKGFDCSGFVKFVFEKQGIDLPRVSKDQANAGKSVPISKTMPGDLLFFSHGGGKIDHVGIVLKNQGNALEMIHASSSKGVIKTDVNSSDYWKKRLKKARRF